MIKTINSERIPIKLWVNDIDDIALNQSKNLANFPYAFKWISIMPDVHPGYGMPIGGILATTDVVVPNAVGVDIGCGMEAVKTSLKNINIDILKNILKDIRSLIPVGFHHHQSPQVWPDFKLAPNIQIIQQELESAKYQLGTLGGGNHFIEILKGDDGYIWLLIHSGSRNFGFKTANFFHQLALKNFTKWGKDVPSKDLAFLPLDSTEGQQYFDAMNFCLNFAKANRNLIMKQLKEIVYSHVQASFEPSIAIHHNYAAIENHFGQDVVVHRKGATKATKGLTGIIPGSMGTPSFIVEGLGNQDSFNSCSHGAGRRLGRNEAIRSLDIVEEQFKMKNILGAPRTRNELQEAPGAYKDIFQVIKDQSDLVKVKVTLSPLAVVTGN